MTYPNVLILGYLNATETAAPATQMQAESYVGTGYQRLLTFEAKGGGFALFGGARPEAFLSAYGLLQLADMARVYPVDPAVAERTARWLLAQQAADGSWASNDIRAGQSSLGTTAFVAWALAEAGYANDAGTAKARDYIRQNVAAEQDPYVVALAANALVAADPKGADTLQTLDRLSALAQRDAEGAYWTGAATMMGSFGRNNTVETTALAAHALLRAGHDLPLAQDALAYIVRAKDPEGTWRTTQATIWSLKALLAAAGAGDVSDTRATVRVALNGGAAQAVELTPENADVVRVLSFTGEEVRPGENLVSIQVTGTGNLMHQVTADYYLPWDAVPPEPEVQPLMTVDVAYDRTTLAVDDLVAVSVRAQLTRAGTARMALLDLGVPPGFTVQVEDLNALVRQQVIARYDLTGRQIVVYVENMSSDKPLEFSYRLKARFPMRAKTQQSAAYDYYNPDQQAIQQPTLLTVTGGS